MNTQFGEVDPKFQTIINDLIDTGLEIVKDWTDKSMSDMNEWFALMQAIMKFTEYNYSKKLSGVEKALCTTNAVVGIANHLYKQYIESLSESEILELRNGKLKTAVLIMDNPEILNASTSFLKELLKYIDINKDNKISKNELRNFFCCCLPSKK